MGTKYGSLEGGWCNSCGKTEHKGHVGGSHRVNGSLNDIKAWDTE